MKKVLFCLVLLGTCLLVGCDRSNQDQTEKQMKLNLFQCETPNIINLDDCEKYHEELTTYTFTTEEFEDVKKHNKREELKSTQLKTIFLGWSDLDLENAQFDKNIISIPTSKDCKTYNVSFDLTYYDWKESKESNINQYAIEERLQTLKSFFEWDNQKWDKISFWDKVVLRFLWWVQGDKKSLALNDKISFYYGESCGSNSNQYEILDSELSINKMLWEINFFYILSDNVIQSGDVENIYSSIDDLIGWIKKEVSARYGKNSNGTYLLSHLSNMTNENITSKDVFVFLTDFFFQLESEDAKKLRKKYCATNGNYCNDSIYQFSEENLSTRYTDGWFFKALFTKHVFKDLSLDLSSLCKNNNEVYLFGISSVPWLSLQNNIKDYYSNYLFKNCEVFYK